MHNGIIRIGSIHKGQVSGRPLVKVVFLSTLDVLPVDGHVLIPIGSIWKHFSVPSEQWVTVLVDEAQNMHQLVEDYTSMVAAMSKV